MADRTRILTASASIVGSGAFALVPIGRMPSRVRWGLGIALSVVPAVVAAAAARRALRERSASERAVAATGAGVAFGAVSLGAWEASVRADRAIERALVRRRVRRPRVVMAAASAALAGVVELLDVVVSRRSEGPRAIER